MQLDLSKNSVFVFFYWLILLSYCKWYLNITYKNATVLIISGLVVELVYWATATTFYMMTGKKAEFQNFIFDHWTLPTMMIGFGLFILCYRHPFRNRFVNYLAASSLGVYLIHYHPGVYRMWTGWFPLRGVIHVNPSNTARCNHHLECVLGMPRIRFDSTDALQADN